MKTAMQELISTLESVGTIEAVLIARGIKDKYLVMEKQQIVDAYNEATKMKYLKGAEILGVQMQKKGLETGEQYYNETYGNESK